MSAISNCTLVLEYNYGQASSDLGSVWLRSGDGTEDLAGAAPLGSLPNWFRIAGPMSYEQASVIHGNLKVFFESNGVTVIDEGIAD